MPQLILPLYTTISHHVAVLQIALMSSLAIRGNKRKYQSFTNILIAYMLHPQAPLLVRICEGVFTMAYRSNIEFVEAKLSLDDQPKVEAFAKKYKGLVDPVIAELLNDGYTLKIGWYPDKVSFAAFVAPTADNKSNNQKMLSAWSDDLAEAIFMVCYKHFVLFEGGEWESNGRSSSWG